MHAKYNLASSSASAEPRFRYFPSIPLPQHSPVDPIAIADMANLFGVTHRTLHFYEEKKLLRAHRVGAMRAYGPVEIKAMALINLCRETGMAIAQIQELLAELEGSGSQNDSDAILRTALSHRKRELISSESLIRRQMQQVNQLLDTDSPDAEDRGGHDLHPPFLSEFEFECLGLMSEGYTPIRIGNVTGRNIDDVLATEAAIIRKFGTGNRFQAVAKAVLLGVIGG
jgi:DNA-binding transcriptional MerR regulator